MNAPRILQRHAELLLWIVAIALAMVFVLALSSRVAGITAPVNVVVSPCEGFFLVGENPGDTPLVRVGSQVTPETVMAYVQGMEKVPVKAGVSGTVLEVMVSDMAVVAEGDALFYVIEE